MRFRTAVPILYTLYLLPQKYMSNEHCFSPPCHQTLFSLSPLQTCSVTVEAIKGLSEPVLSEIFVHELGSAPTTIIITEREDRNIGIAHVEFDSPELAQRVSHSVIQSTQLEASFNARGEQGPRGGGVFPPNVTDVLVVVRRRSP